LAFRPSVRSIQSNPIGRPPRVTIPVITPTVTLIRNASSVATYAPDAELLPPTHTIAKGPAEIEKFFDGLLKSGVKNHALKLVEAGGTDKVMYGTANWSAADKDGKPIGGLATHVFERQGDGSLKLKAHIFN
jgi:ketosteroid isomerase-like protein